ncbi:MAG: ABC transporter permease subunit [Actinophytocola sp.]|nr:ABC transporter permease subunit [Actinophytocola sp.]
MLKAINALLAVLGGVGGALALYFLLNKLVEVLPPRWEERLKPYVFVFPAMLFVTLFLVYPAVRTAIFSFFDDRGENFVGLDNYTSLLGESAFLNTLFNNALWLIIVPAGVVIAGLIVAVLADQLRTRGENFVKSMIFLPMAISFVGASTIWRFVYAFAPEGRPQIGLLNAVWTSAGFEPVAWIQVDAARFNSFLLMVIMIWLQTGFAMVLLSAAIKSVPAETLEAARIDGASEMQIFFQVVVPQIWGTVITVFITVLILTMKIFDIIYVMTGGRANTDVIGNRFITELINFGRDGRASAIVVMLMLAVIPVMIYQVRRFRATEGAR